MDSWGIYVHIPWCESRCPYCAFNTYVEKAPPFRAYTDAILQQWAAHQADFQGAPSTIFFGGGTPSLHPPELIGALIEAFQPASNAEITLEANPGGSTKTSLSAYRDAGINRVSLGIQTFHSKHARFLNRGHSVDDARQLLADVAATGFNSWSADLIFALPHQSLSEWAEDLQALLDCEPPHVSLYGLTAEEGTPYTNALKKGRFPVQDEELWEAMMDTACEQLEQAGLQRYEVSNWAHAGHQSRHNSLYWRGKHWMGLGAGAHGWHPQGLRTVGHLEPQAFIQNPNTWKESHTSNSKESAIELMLSTIRHIDGIPLGSLHQLGWNIQRSKIAHHLENGLLVYGENALQVRTRGWKLINSLLLSLESALEPISHNPSAP